jgi:hypothetical protein
MIRVNRARGTIVEIQRATQRKEQLLPFQCERLNNINGGRDGRDMAWF